jgi:hypothetical protein
MPGQPIDYTVHITFYEEGTERMLASVDHAQVPRAGEKVWLTTHDYPDGDEAPATKDIACWQVRQVVWHYTAPSSMSGLDGKMGGIVDIIVFRSQGVFK